MSENAELLWGARFKAAPAASLTALSRSPNYYFALAPYDLAGCRAHVRELARAELLSAGELSTMLAAIDALDGKLHAGRSRNDQTVNDLRLYLHLRDNGRKLVSALSAADLAYVAPCENSIDAVASRDYAAEFLFVTSMIGINLSRLCERENCGLADLSDAQMHGVEARLTPEVRQALTLEARSGYGGTASQRVREQLARLQTLIQDQPRWADDYAGPRV